MRTSLHQREPGEVPRGGDQIHLYRGRAARHRVRTGHDEERGDFGTPGQRRGPWGPAM